MRVLFWFRKSGAKSQADKNDPSGAIQVRITIDNQECEVGSSKVSCQKSKWSSAEQRIIGSTAFTQKENAKLLEICTGLQRLYDLLVTKYDFVPPELIKEYYHNKRKFTYTIKEVFDLYMQHREWQASKKMITNSTLTVCYNYIRHATDFARDWHILKPVQIDSMFFVSFYNYILENDRGAERFSRKATCFAKQALKWGYQKGYVPRLTAFDEPLPGFGESEKKIDTTHLTIWQLQQLFKYDFFENVRSGLITEQSANTMSQERDAFVFNCFTGMHHCDYIRKEFTVEPYRDALFLRGTRLKTGISFSIKLLEPAVEILRRYNNSLADLPIKSNQKRNETLKQIAIFAKIPLRLTTKVARKTFCDMALNEMLMSPDDVSACLGLTSTKYLHNYGRIREARLLKTMKDWSELKQAS